MRVGSFDVVLFLGVLYHLRDPPLPLERVSSVTTHMLILETVVTWWPSAGQRRRSIRDVN